ncbi:MAG: class I SAM-dependent methyltransferase [Sphingomonadales bacterium]
MNVRRVIQSARFLARSSAPLPVIAAMIRDRIDAPRVRRRFGPRRSEFEAGLAGCDFSTDWFTSRLCHWLDMFERYPLPAGAEILEIGSWEGMSTLFMLSTWPDARITCVDTWEGGWVYRGTPQARDSEGRFDAHTARFADRITKFRGTSAAYFDAAAARDRFDFVYVDGSHGYADVLGDAFAGFEALKPGGIMLFDDYLMAPRDGVQDCPGPAVNRMLREKRGQYRVIAANWQLAIRKLPQS